jgi:hypothetical protein
MKRDTISNNSSSFRNEFIDMMNFLGFTKCENDLFSGQDAYEFKATLYNKCKIHITVVYSNIENTIFVMTSDSTKVNEYTSIDKCYDAIINYFDSFQYQIIENCVLLDTQYRQNVIQAAINTRDAAKNMVRVKSSNVWSYGINVRKHGDNIGDVLCQFKGTNGGPGDLYIYYDVPIRVYKRWVSAPSKGHYFWQYIRNNYKYSKLTGNKKGVLPNAIN